MNVNYLASSSLGATYPKIIVELFLYDGQTNDMGQVTPNYTGPFEIEANIQFASPQKLEHVEGYNRSKIYKNFWINSETLTAINRNISTGGDYIRYNNLYYKIVAVNEQFKTGWILLVGCEGRGLND